jgi:CSLREA domain-containing protein
MKFRVCRANSAFRRESGAFALSGDQAIPRMRSKINLSRWKAVGVALLSAALSSGSAFAQSIDFEGGKPAFAAINPSVLSGMTTIDILAAAPARITIPTAAPCTAPATVYVDDNWVGVTPGTDPDGAGPATNFGCDSFATIQDGVNGVAAGGTVMVAAGTYDEDVSIGKASLTLVGEGSGVTNIRGAIGGDGATIHVLASNVTIAGFTITRLGNNTTDWNNAGLNTVGIAIQGQAVTGTLIHDNVLTGNRTGIDINNSNGHTVRNNVIDFNRTGLIFRNQTDNETVQENFITNNWTVGVLFLDASSGTNSPVQTAANSPFRNNNLSGNWYGQIVDRQSGALLPAPGTTNLKDFRGDWFGTTSPVITTANSAEPGYAAQIPVAYGGSATPPGGQPDIAGPASANFRINPILLDGTDTNLETTPGRGTFGFQGVAPMVVVTPATSPTATDNDYTRINDAVQAAISGEIIKLAGTFDWTEPNATASWALGSNGLPGDLDDFSILIPANLNNVTITADNLGDATIQGPGDVAAVDLEGVFFFDSQNGSKNQNWTISKIRFVDFDLSIGMFWDTAGASDAFLGTTIANDYIKIAKDLNATVAPTDSFQNIGIHFSFGKNQTISGNTIEFDGDGVSDGTNLSSQVGMQSNSGAGDSYDGLQITNNTLRVLNAQSANPQFLLGIWENGAGHTSNITISGNSFTNLAAGNAPASNLQRAFRITSHSSSTTAVNYVNNTVIGANIGFQWAAEPNFSGTQAVNLKSNSILGNATGVLVQSQGVANLFLNRIVGNTSGLNNVDGTVTAENNWWGCNAGPGNAGCDAVTGIADFDPWIVLAVSASPNNIPPGGTSNVTADMSDNSAAADTTGVGFLPNMPVSWSATEGAMSPSTGTITSDTASSTFTSTSSNSGSACGMVDNQSLCSAIGVTPPSFSIDDVTHNEGDAGTTTFTFTVTKTGASGLSSSVQFTTQDGTATTAGADYAASSGTLTFPASATTDTQTITVSVNGDTIIEATEAFTVELSSPSGATITDGSGTGTITNDDSASFSIDDVTQAETNSGQTAFTFTVTKTGNATASVDYATQDGTATAGSDYVANAGALNFAASDATKTITVMVNGDTTPEPDETFTVQLSNQSAGATISDASGTGTISNDDASFTIDDVTQPEANSGQTTFTFTVTKTGNIAASVDFATQDGTAMAGSDYVATNGTLNFAPGDTTKQIIVTVSGDTTPEPTETFTVHLSNASAGATIADADGLGTITFDDLPPIVYVDDDWASVPAGTDPDGAGPATAMGYDAFATIQGGVNGVAVGGMVVVRPGTYDEDVAVNKAGLSLIGDGSGTTNIRGAIGGDGATIRVSASNVTIAGFTITRLGNNTTDWNNPGLNTAGIAIQGQAVTGTQIHDNVITGNRTGIDINNSNGHAIHNNVIDFNRTGLIFRNQTDNQTVVENFITNNWTVGVLFLDGSGGTNSPPQQALNSHFKNNNITANWYGQVVDRQSGGAIPPPGYTNLKNFTRNWWGTTNPAVTTANSAEPGYAAQIPVAYGGTATPPGGQPDIAGPASANIVYLPLLCSGTDTNVETTPGWGTFGFQGGASCPIEPATTPTATDNDYTRINNAVQAASSGETIKLLGTFDWTETNAAASWATGSNYIPGDLDDYSILVPANLNNVTFTADNVGDATIQGPGDLAALDLEGVFFFNSANGSKNQNWTISNIRFVEFDLSIGMFQDTAGASDAFLGTSIINNYIKIAKDLNATVAPNDSLQNIGIHYSFGKNQTISSNTIVFDGNGVSDGTNFSSQIGMQSNTSGGEVYDGLQITNNTLQVLNAQSANPQVILGIWENGHAHTSNITVSGNSFTNLAAGNNPATNLERAFRVTSHSSATSVVDYEGNTVMGANIGFQWLAGSNFAGTLPVIVKSNTIIGNATGVLVQSQGVANLLLNRIVENTTAGLNNVDGTVKAENNWWGCNAGPGNTGCDAVTGTADYDPWIVLAVSASPNTITPGGTSTVTADMSDNSAAMDTTGLGLLPDMPVDWSATEGTMNPTSGTIMSDTATSTFTSTSSNSGSGCAMVDNQLVCASINVTAPSFSIDDVTHDEGNSGTTTYTFTVTKSGSTALSSSVDFTTQDGTALVSDNDYQLSTGTLNFGPTETTKTITVLVNGDVKFENTEAFNVHLSNPSGVTISDADGTGTITNDDAAPTFTIDDVTHLEGNSGITSYTFTITKAGSTEVNASVDYATEDGTATWPSDFTAIAATPVTFLPNETAKQVMVNVNGDTTVESDETFKVKLSNAVDAVIADGEGLGTIKNDDTDVSVALAAPTSVKENGTQNLVYTFTRNPGTSGDITVNFTVGGTAMFGSDYSQSGAASFTTNSGTVVIPDGATSATVTIDATSDNVPESDETVVLTVTAGNGYNVGSSSSATGTIENDDAAVTVTVSAASVAEDGTSNLVYTFTRSPLLQGELTIAFSVGGTATYNSDYTVSDADSFSTTSGTVTFADGSSTATVTVDPAVDTIYEANETVILTVGSGTGYSSGSPSTATGTINNDDPAPTLAIGDRIAFEGNSGGTTNFAFTVTKSGATEVPVTVDYATANGTTNPAVGGGSCGGTTDYISKSGTLTFPASGSGSASQSITISVCADTAVEPNETFFVQLSNPTEATISDNEGRGTIQNDDAPPPLVPVNTTDDVNDGLCNAAHCSLREAIVLANAGSSAVTINFAIPATDSRHFYYVDDGIPNHVTNDATHVVATTAASDTSLPADNDPDWPHSWYSILPTAALPPLSQTAVIDGYTQTGSTANTVAAMDNAVLKIELDGATAGVATNGLTVSASGATVRGLVINRFTGNGISLSGGNATVAGNFIGTDVSGTVDLGNAGHGLATTGFSQSIGSSTPADANLISGNNGDGMLFSNSNSDLIVGNYIGTKADGTTALGNSGNGVTFFGGSSVFNILGGTQSADRNVIAFNGADGVDLSTAGVSNTIRGNSIFSNGTTANHLGIDLGGDGVTANDAQDPDGGPNGLQNFPTITSALVTGSTRTIKGTLNSAAGQTYDIDFYASASCDSSGNGQGQSYLGSITTSTTDSNGNVSFTFHPDATHAPAMTVGKIITATATTTGAFGDTSEFSQCFTAADGSPGAGDIQFTAAEYMVSESGGTAAITVVRVGGSNGTITANLSTSNGSATAPGDYIALTDFPITYADAEVGPKTVNVTINNDSIYEDNETIKLSLSATQITAQDGVTAPSADPHAAVLTIADNDVAPSFSINSVSHSEGNSGTTAYTFTVTKTGLTEKNSSVNYNTVDGTATAPSDFAAVPMTTLTFLPNDTTKQFTVQVNGDSTVEPDEEFTVHLDTAVDATISNADGTGTIVNDDVNPSPTPTATATATATATPNPTATATATAAPSATATATATATPTATPTATAVQALNISTRLRVETGDNAMIAGFIITGNASKPVVLRGIGPSLTGFGITDPLVDPILELRGPNSSLIKENDNWKDDQRPQIEGTLFQPTDDRESVILATLPPAAYTSVLTGKANGTGVGLIEVYDNGTGLDSELANISTRGLVQGGNSVMIGGFILGGSSNTSRIAFRGIGPSLAQFGLTNLLPDPTLEVHDANGMTIVSNDNWTDDAVSAAQLTANGLALKNQKEAGIFTALPAGQFTVILAGKNGGVGIGLVEIYNLK